MVPHKKETESRFWSNIDKSSDCWNWTGKRDHGYGYFAWPKNALSHWASVAVYQILRGSVPHGQKLYRHCGNAACCNPDHLFLGANGLHMKPRDETQEIAVFWNLVDRTSGSACWQWLGGKGGGKKGQYGSFSWKEKRKAVHLISYELNNGKIPKGLHILHSCDNPGCVNPQHLRADTNRANIEDCVRKGRHIQGERCWNSKLNAEKVRRIRELYNLGVTYEKIGKMFLISPACALHVVHRITWKHIT